MPPASLDPKKPPTLTKARHCHEHDHNGDKHEHCHEHENSASGHEHQHKGDDHCHEHEHGGKPHAHCHDHLHGQAHAHEHGEEHCHEHGHGAKAHSHCHAHNASKEHGHAHGDKHCHGHEHDGKAHEHCHSHAGGPGHSHLHEEPAKPAKSGEEHCHDHEHNGKTHSHCHKEKGPEHAHHKKKPAPKAESKPDVHDTKVLRCKLVKKSHLTQDEKEECWWREVLAKTRAADRADNLEDKLEGKDKTGSMPLPPPEERMPETSAPAGEERPVPNYDQREGEGITAGKVLVWIPRIALYPVHLVLNYLFRVPIVWAVTRIEEYYIIQRVQRFFTWRNGQTGVNPYFLVDFGVNPAVGLNFFNNDWPRGNNLSVSVATWGKNWLHATVRNNTTVFRNDSGRISVYGDFLRRPDQPFYGIGPVTDHDDRRNYRIQQGMAGMELWSALTGLNRAILRVEYRNAKFKNNAADTRGGEEGRVPDTTDNTVGGLLGSDVIPGFGDGYNVVDTRLHLIFDNRDPDTEFNNGTGIRLEAFGNFSFNPNRTAQNFFKWGGQAAGFWDISGIGHTLALRVYGEFIEESGGFNYAPYNTTDLSSGRQVQVTSGVPFTELISLGGDQSMRGFLNGRFRGESAFVTTLSYRYPIWSIIDAELFASVGNVFNGHYRDFRPDRLHLSFGTALRTNLARDNGISVLVAAGTKRFDEDNFSVESFRFSLGFFQGF